MKKREKSGIFTTFLVIFMITPLLILVPSGKSNAQIWEPEGINMPGGWNSWTNPPLNNLALASSTQVAGGRVIKFSAGIQRWQTIFSVAESGADIVGGSYSWLFTSGPTGNPWGNKWANVTVAMNTLQTYTKEGSSDNQITVVNGKWYTMNFEDAGYMDTRAIFMETTAEPVLLTTVSQPGTVNPGEAVIITLTLNTVPSAEEVFYLRYSADAWATSTAIPFNMTGNTGTAQIPGQPADTTVSYYAFSSVISGLTDLFDLYTIRLNNNNGTNYNYTVTNPAPVITFANLQSPPSGVIESGQSFQVTGHVLIPGITGQPIPAPGLEAWVGWSGANTHPNTWTNWTTASYSAPSSFFDVFMANLGSVLTSEGTWYYATRFRYNGGDYVYGGFSTGGGGFWDGINQVSGILTILPPSVPVNRTIQNYSVEPEMSVCFDATQTITVAGGDSYFKVLAGGSTNLIAGERILLLPGTGVAAGGYLHAWIAPGGPYCNAPGKSAASTYFDGDNEPAFNHSPAPVLYPNPASSTLTLRWDPLQENFTLTIFSVHGQWMMTETLTGAGDHRINLTVLKPGLYIIKIVSGEKLYTTKLIKL